jgi:hypothetical protein
MFAELDRHYRASFIDQGFCFNEGHWQLKDAPLRGCYAKSSVYQHVTSWESFEPWLTAVEEFPIDRLWRIASTIPSAWYEDRQDELEHLICQLIARRKIIRELIVDFRESSRNPFPHWR